MSSIQTNAAGQPEKNEITWQILAVCLLYESLIVIAVVVGGIIIPFTLLGAVAHYVASGKLLMAATLLLLLIYFAWQWTHGGQTLAMKTWRIQLVGEASPQVTTGQAVTRFSIALMGSLLLGIHFLWRIVDRDGCFLHDRLAGTRLIRQKKKPA